MGVKTVLAGLTISTAGKTQAEIAACDIAGLLWLCEKKCEEISNTLTYLVNDVLTPGGGDGSNITTINTQITNLS
jgi:hypothetical protein